MRIIRSWFFYGNKRRFNVIYSLFQSLSHRHDDLKVMLDGNRDNLKLEAMKRIISMVAKVCTTFFFFCAPEVLADIWSIDRVAMRPSYFRPSSKMSFQEISK